MTPQQLNGKSNDELDKLAFINDLRKKVYPYQTLGEIVRRFEEYERIPLIKGVMYWGETSAWIGPPGSLKSALLASAAICVAAGVDWLGRRVNHSAGVIYFAFERADLVRRRLVAQATRMGLDPATLNIMVVSELVDLMDPASAKRIIELLEASIHIFPRYGRLGALGAGLVIFDTFAKGIAAGGGDEDKAKDQGRVYANLQRVKNSIAGPHIALVGHTGKDESRGMRGSSAAAGDFDVLVQISGDTTKTATIIKANDLPEGPLFSFTSAVHEFGTDEDGDPITVNVISSEAVEEEQARTTKRRLSPRQQNALTALSEAVLSKGQPPAFDLPAGISVVTVESWRDELFSRGVLSDDDANPRQEFKRLGEQLAARGHIGRKDGFVWLAR